MEELSDNRTESEPELVAGRLSPAVLGSSGPDDDAASSDTTEEPETDENFGGFAGDRHDSEKSEASGTLGAKGHDLRKDAAELDIKNSSNDMEPTEAELQTSNDDRPPDRPSGFLAGLKYDWKKSLEPPKAKSLNEAKPEDFPDNGFGWVVVISCFLNYVFALGLTYAFGVYQREYFYGNVFQGATQFQIAWAGSISAATQFIVGPFAGTLGDRWGNRNTCMLGGCFVLVGFVAASFSTALWQTYLSQGVCYGIGCGLVYFSLITAPSHWFYKKRALALGIAVAGGGVGGFLIGPMTQSLISSYGWRWSLRITGLVGGGITFFASLFIRPRFEVPKTKTKIFDWKYFKDYRFSMLYFARLPAAFGFFVPFSFIPSMAVNAGMTAEQGSLALGLVNGASAVGRVALGYFGDRWGVINSYAICQLLTPIVILCVWPFANNFPTLIVFSILLGFFSGGYISLFPIVTAQLFGLQGLGALTGVLFTSTLPGNLAGAPIGGLIVDSTATTQPDGSVSFNYLPLIIYCGGLQLSSGIVNAVLRMKQADWKVMKKL